jgi:hypothetical protein
MYAVVRTTKTLTANVASYTIGSGGDINLVRPLWIEDAAIVLDITATDATEIGIDVLTDEQYARWPLKSLKASQALALYYDHGWTAGLGKLYPLPIPNVSTTQLVIYTPQQPASQFADYNTTSYTFPPAVRRMLRKNLALELAPSYPASVVSSLLLQQAKDSKAQFKSSNVRPLLREGNRALTGPGTTYNPNTDRYNR